MSLAVKTCAPGTNVRLEPQQFPSDFPIFDQGSCCHCPQPSTHVYRARVGHKSSWVETVSYNLLILLALPRGLQDRSIFKGLAVGSPEKVFRMFLARVANPPNAIIYG
jgi:hypothetical protein